MLCDKSGRRNLSNRKIKRERKVFTNIFKSTDGVGQTPCREIIIAREKKLVLKTTFSKLAVGPTDLSQFVKFPLLTFTKEILNDKLFCTMRFVISIENFLFAEISSDQLKVFVKVGFSSSKKNCFICFNENPLKMMKNVFLFYFKISFRSEDIWIFVLTF